MDELTPYRAQRLMQLGLWAVERGWLPEARHYFKESARTVRTADALTYWGWIEHHLGRTKLAIRLCKKAISLDPDFGNPYNDIGSYLMSLDQYDEAIPWLEQATSAKRYEPRQFPHMNLGRIFVTKKSYFRALSEFRKALKYAPDDLELQAVVQNLRKKMAQLHRLPETATSR